jgi:hypothetical protein
VASEAERKRDMGNIVHDDRKFLDIARSRGMPEAAWADWWPTLEELREGAGGSPDRHRRRPHGRRRRDVAGAVRLPPAVPRVARRERDRAHRPAGHLLRLGAGSRDELAAIGAPSLGSTSRATGITATRARCSGCGAYLAKRAKGEYVFQAEDDFVYDRPVSLEPMIDTLRDEPHVRQLALLRGAYYARELEAGPSSPR